MMLGMLHSPSHQSLNSTRGYEREVSSREVALFGALLVLPVALLVILSLVSG
jgi:hypothetical protein